MAISPAGARPPRPHALSPTTLGLVFSIWLTAFYNDRFWQILLANTPLDSVYQGLFVAAAFVFIALWLNLFVQLATLPRVFKPVLILLLLIAALADHFTSRYGVIIDKSMIQNVFQTDTHEATELFSGSLVRQLLLWVLIPAAAILALPLRWQGWRRELLARAGVYVAGIAVMAGLFFGFNKDFTFLFRQHPELRSLITPTYPIHATLKYLRERHAEPTVREAIGTDAHLGPAADTQPRKTLFVLVVGETARAENFGLNGYARDTTPELGALDVIDFGHTESCGTSTAESLPCMFSHLDRSDYEAADAARYENLLDVLDRAGVDTLWIDNQGGCKGVCERFTHVNTREMADPQACTDGECHDEIMLKVLKERVLDDPAARARDHFVVLHQMGSHGPAYYRRVPESFRRFTPECRSVNLQECTRDEVVNSYDNTILYTDHFLAQTIRTLRADAADFDVVFYYVSDHGESLGENGLYLHGMPRLFAPDQQTRVPALMWVSNGFRDDQRVDTACVAQRRGAAYSHDNLFHTVLGSLDVETRLYRPDEDLLNGCRSPIRQTASEQAPAGRVEPGS